MGCRPVLCRLCAEVVCRVTGFLEQRAEVASMWLAIEISAVAALSERVCVRACVCGIVNNYIVKIF